MTFSSFGCAGCAPAAGGDAWAGGDGLDGGTAEMRPTARSPARTLALRLARAVAASLASTLAFVGLALAFLGFWGSRKPRKANESQEKPTYFPTLAFGAPGRASPARSAGLAALLFSFVDIVQGASCGRRMAHLASPRRRVSAGRPRSRSTALISSLPPASRGCALPATTTWKGCLAAIAESRARSENSSVGRL